MADTLLCLDIHKDTVIAVGVERSTKANVVTGCGTTEIIEQSFYAAIDKIKEQTGFVSGSSIVTFGAELFSFRNLSLPFTERKKIEQVLPFELEDRLPVQMKSVLVDFVVAKEGPHGADIIAAMINREYLTDKLAILNSRGINPDLIGISGLSTALNIAEEGDNASFILIDIGTKWATIFIIVDRQIALIRSLTISMSAQEQSGSADTFFQSVKQTLLACRLLDLNNRDYCVYLAGIDYSWVDQASVSQCLGGVETRRYEGIIRRHVTYQPDIKVPYQSDIMDRVLSAALKGGAKGRGVNFRKDDFKKSKSSREYRQLLLKSAVPLVVALVVFTGYWGYEYRSLLSQQEKLRNQIADIFRETVSGVEKIVNPIHQLQVINNQIRATYKPGGNNKAGFTVIELLAELSSRIPGSYKVKVLRLVADADTLRIKAITGDYNTVDNIQKELEKSHFFKNVIINSANQSSQNDEVSFELKLELSGE
jgi:general secretion pathway protein L